MTERLAIRADPDLLRQLDARSREEDRPVARIVRAALRSYLAAPSSSEIVKTEASK